MLFMTCQRAGARHGAVPGSPGWGLVWGNKSAVMKPPEPMEEDRDGGQDTHRVVAPVKKEQ
jgi:hypothetical protein